MKAATTTRSITDRIKYYCVAADMITITVGGKFNGLNSMEFFLARGHSRSASQIKMNGRQHKEQVHNKHDVVFWCQFAACKISLTHIAT